MRRIEVIVKNADAGKVRELIKGSGSGKITFLKKSGKVRHMTYSIHAPADTWPSTPAFPAFSHFSVRDSKENIDIRNGLVTVYDTHKNKGRGAWRSIVCDNVNDLISGERRYIFER